jgi:aminoglycoside phosphotransferase (APT) family kinase protein
MLVYIEYIPNQRQRIEKSLADTLSEIHEVISAMFLWGFDRVEYIKRYKLADWIGKVNRWGKIGT